MNRSALLMLAFAIVLAGLVPAMFMWDRARRPMGDRVDEALSSLHNFDSLRVIDVRELPDITAVVPINPLRLRVLGERVLIPRQATAVQFRAWKMTGNAKVDSRRVRMEYSQAGQTIRKEFSADDKTPASLAPADSIAAIIEGGPVLYIPNDTASLSFDLLDGTSAMHVDVKPTLTTDQFTLCRYGPGCGEMRRRYIGDAEAAARIMRSASVLPREQVAVCVQDAADRLTSLTDEQTFQRYLTFGRGNVFAETDANKMAELVLLAVGKAGAEAPSLCVHFHVNGLSIYSLRFGPAQARWLVFSADQRLLWSGELRSNTPDGFVDDPELAIAGFFSNPRGEAVGK